MKTFKIGQKVVIRITNEAGTHEARGTVTAVNQYAAGSVTVWAEYKGQFAEWCGPSKEVFADTE